MNRIAELGAGSGIAGGWRDALALIDLGGAAMWAIAALSVLTLATILWKVWRLACAGVWRRARAERALALWSRGDRRAARAEAAAGRGVCASVVAAALAAVETLPEEHARSEVTRVAKRRLAESRAGLRLLELVAIVAPLLGLLGTVLGMIAAFRQLQASGMAADPAVLAGGIWEALLTTAAGMSVAIPATIALTWFESVTDRLRLDLEDMATRVFAAPPAAARPARAAE
jgi:biopolymer transport protein ExbB